MDCDHCPRSRPEGGPRRERIVFVGDQGRHSEERKCNNYNYHLVSGCQDVNESFHIYCSTKPRRQTLQSWHIQPHFVNAWKGVIWLSHMGSISRTELLTSPHPQTLLKYL